MACHNDRQVLNNYFEPDMTQLYVSIEAIVCHIHLYFVPVHVTIGRGDGERYETCIKVVQEAFPIALARPYSKHVLPPGTKVSGFTCIWTPIGCGARYIDLLLTSFLGD